MPARVQVPPPPPSDVQSLASQEAALAEVEARWAAALADLHGREEALARAVEAHRQELVALSQSHAGSLAQEAMRALPPVSPPDRGPTPDRLRAEEARLLALEMRRQAVAAEQRSFEARHAQLATHEQMVTAASHTTAAIREKAAELARAEAAELARQRAAAEAAAAAAAAAAEATAAAAAAASSPTSSAALEAERRRKGRVRMNAEVTLTSDSNFYSGFSSDLSEGGIFIACSKVEEHGTEVDLTFTLAGSTRIEAKGIVRWTREHNDNTPEVWSGMGIEFTELPPEAHQAIRAFTQQREPIFWA